MKYFFPFLFLLLTLSAFGQNTSIEFDAEKWEPPYQLSFPKNWGVERFSIPISFAPQIPYTGVEDIRFAPGWAKIDSSDYWTYAFLWYLDGKQKTNAKILKNNLTAYYTGLVEAMRADIPAGKLVPVKTTIKKVKTQKGDVKTFRGSIFMLDYMAKKPIHLNCLVHLKFCSEQDKTFILFKISPKAYDDNVWQGLHQLWADFSCNKTVDIK